MGKAKIKGKARVRAMLFPLQNGRCCYCFVEMVLRGGNPTTDNWATLEHKIPKRYGGRLSEDNTILSCRRCNNIKSDMTHTDFILLLACCGVSIELVVFHLQWAAALTRIVNRKKRKLRNEVR